MLTLALRSAWPAAHTFATSGVVSALREAAQCTQAEGVEAGRDVIEQLVQAAPVAAALQMIQVLAPKPSSSVNQ